MSLLNWLFPDSKSQKLASTTRPSGVSSGVEKSQPDDRKNVRVGQRERLYTVIREAMVHTGVLSSSYKFKVLSLDPRGRKFMVMMDLPREYGHVPDRLAEIEALIVQSAKSRYSIVVTSVYWRLTDKVSAGKSQTLPTAWRASMPAPLGLSDSAPAPLATPRPRQFEPVEDEEVAAFKRALLASTTGAASARAMADASPVRGPQSYTLLTGFEDTEMPDENPALSGTQYGALT